MAPFLELGRDWPREHAPPHMGYHVEFDRCWSNDPSVLMEIHLENVVVASRPAFQGHSRSLKPTSGDFLLTFLIVAMGVYCTVSKI